MESSVIFIGCHRDLCFPAKPLCSQYPNTEGATAADAVLVARAVVTGGMNCQLPTTGHHDRSEINE